MPNSPIQLRMATAHDAGAIADIYRPYVLGSVVTFEKDPPGTAEMAERIESVCGPFPWLVCLRGGAVIGYGYATRFGQRAGYGWSAESSVYLRQDTQGTGAGRAVYTALISLLRHQGYRSLYARVTVPGPQSERFHEKMGFTRQGLLAGVGYKFGRPVSTAYYALQLLPEMQDPPTPVPHSALDGALVQAILAGHNE